MPNFFDLFLDSEPPFSSLYTFNNGLHSKALLRSFFELAKVRRVGGRLFFQDEAEEAGEQMRADENR